MKYYLEWYSRTIGKTPATADEVSIGRKEQLLFLRQHLAAIVKRFEDVEAAKKVDSYLIELFNAHPCAMQGSTLKKKIESELTGSAKSGFASTIDFDNV